MTSTDDRDLTRLLRDAANGDADAGARLVPVVYEQLRAMARAQLRGDRATLEPTALVHEAWLRLGGTHANASSWDHRGHFFAAAARAMRRILVDRARARQAMKRRTPCTRDLGPIADDGGDPDLLLDVDAALARLEAEHPREARVVLLRYFGGLEVREVAAALGVSVGTVERDWRLARARLQRELGRPPV